eukprot:1143131-Pelagomonas_calceolata.AAC.5
MVPAIMGYAACIMFHQLWRQHCSGTSLTACAVATPCARPTMGGSQKSGAAAAEGARGAQAAAPGRDAGREDAGAVEQQFGANATAQRAA